MSLQNKILLSFSLVPVIILSLISYAFYSITVDNSVLNERSLAQYFLLIYLVALFILLLLTNILTKRIISPLDKLIKSMKKKISYGAYSQPLQQTEVKELDMLTIFFNRMSEEILNKNRILEQKIREISQLFEFNKVSNSSSSLEEIDNLLSKSLDIFQVEYGFLFILRKDTKQIEEIFASNIDSQKIDDLKNIIMRKVSKDSLRKGSIFLVPFSDKEFNGFVCVPLYIKKNLIGVLGADDIITRRGFSDGPQVSLFVDISMQLTTFIERIQLYETLERKLEERKKELAALLNVGEAANENQDLENILQTIVKITVDIMSVEKCGIRLYDEKNDQLTLEAYYGLSKEYVQKAKKVSPNKTLFDVVRIGEPFIISDLSKVEEIEIDGSLIKEGLQSAFSMPLFAKDKVLGTIIICSTKPHYYTDEEKVIYTALANQAAITIENARLYDNLQQAYLETIRALIGAIEAKDSYTKGHAERVSSYSLAIGAELNLEKEFLDNLEVAAILHDIGKIGIPEQVLSKPGRLTNEEFNIMKNHPLRGREILQPVKFSQEIIEGVYCHHERLDGKGYPNGLMHEQIPLVARILAVADAFDAMTSTRPYRSYLSYQHALNELVRCSGSQFDPSIVEAFHKVWEKHRDNLVEKHQEDKIETA